MNLEEKILEEKLIHKGNFLEFVNVDVELPNKEKANRDVVKHPGAAAVLAFLDDENIVLVEQYRLPIKQVMIEIPAGKLDKNEDPKVSAVRELEEETGYKAENIEYLGRISTAPGFCDEIIYIYKAENLTIGEKHEDEDEFTNVKIVNISEVKEMIKKGEIIDCKTLSAFAFL